MPSGASKRVAFNIAPLYTPSGDLQTRAGIHYAADAWLAALLRVAANEKTGENWDIRAFAPLGIASRLQEQAADGAFSWWPEASVGATNGLPPFVDTAGTRNKMPTNPLLRRVWARQGLAQARNAARNYDLMHFLTPSYLPLEKYAPEHCLATIWDTTPLTRPETHTKENRASWETYFGWAKKKASAAVTISQAAKAEIVEHLQIDPARVFVVPLAPRAGVRFVPAGAERDQLLQSVGLAPNVPFILYAGTLEPRKNVARLVRALAHLVRYHLPQNAPLQLVLAGGVRENYDLTLREVAESKQITSVAERVLFPGYVSGDVMNALMSACNVFAYPSLEEGFGMPPLEAMVCGAPVVTSNVSSLPEVVGDAGLQIDPNDTEALTNALHTLLTDVSENARRRELSRARAAQFSWDETARQTLAIYDAVLSGASAKAGAA